MCQYQHNILVDSNGRAFVKGSGLSTMLDEIAESESYETRLGDVPWTAPELMINSSSGIPTSQSDVWSFGCNMIHVLISFIDDGISVFNNFLLGSFWAGALAGSSR